MNTEFKPNSIKNLCMEIQAKGQEEGDSICN